MSRAPTPPKIYIVTCECINKIKEDEKPKTFKLEFGKANVTIRDMDKFGFITRCYLMDPANFTRTSLERITEKMRLKQGERVLAYYSAMNPEEGHISDCIVLWNDDVILFYVSMLDGENAKVDVFRGSLT